MQSLLRVMALSPMTQSDLSICSPESGSVLTHHGMWQDWRKKLGSDTQLQPPAPAMGPPKMAKPFGADIEFHYARVSPPPDAAELDSVAVHAESAPVRYAFLSCGQNQGDGVQ